MVLELRKFQRNYQVCTQFLALSQKKVLVLGANEMLPIPVTSI